MESTIEQVKNRESLSGKWDKLKDENPKLRTKDVADRLGVSEAELVASKCDGNSVIRLTSDWAGIFNGLEALGKIMALTRNESAVHEKNGVYQNVSFKGHAGLVLDENIDLRVFHKRWGFGFAVPVENPRGILHSLQFFDKTGAAVHKIYVKDESKLDIYRDLVEKYRDTDQTTFIETEEKVAEQKTISLEEIDKEKLLDEWANLKDTHDFYPLLRKYKAERTGALELAEKRFTTRLPNSATRLMLQIASEKEVPIMVFVGNRGMIQIHSGPVKKIKVMDNWLNVLDPDFNLHLREDHILKTWIVEKPTEDGTVTSLEIFANENRPIATFFGARKPGMPELESWREITEELKKLEA